MSQPQEKIGNSRYNPSNPNQSTEVKSSGAENIDQTTSILCPSYKITNSQDGYIKCVPTFPLGACNTIIKVYLEVWISENRLLQSSKKEVFVDCNASGILINR